MGRQLTAWFPVSTRVTRVVVDLVSLVIVHAAASQSDSSSKPSGGSSPSPLDRSTKPDPGLWERLLAAPFCLPPEPMGTPAPGWGSGSTIWPQASPLFLVNSLASSLRVKSCNFLYPNILTCLPGGTVAGVWSFDPSGGGSRWTPTPDMGVCFASSVLSTSVSGPGGLEFFRSGP